MNALAKMARSTYSAPRTSTRSYRDIEYEILSRITYEMIHAASVRGNHATFVRALHRNRRLWRIFRDDIANKENALPDDLRNNLYQLAGFVELETGNILTGNGDHQVLVEINRTVMRGLLPEKGNKT